ncbi:hypothetical protein DNHGIG_39660 [Collibacillus ludicampi]|uniref:Uncharacterized protein n=1 Tax=Collibacillus ludicampi TaxID=2771369 RepID=A0AAV4LMX9_9BACL|nr:hypothetical protein [Collibacillus ludicampi]GIM48417.1 hypothetical protein DNHGIG_39660 [Collibacillus ludicampi]
MVNIEERRHWLEDGQEPTLPYYIEFADGRRGEAVNPSRLMDLIIHEYFSDVDDPHTFYLLGVKCLRDIAAGPLAMMGVRATVYDGVGPFYDTAISRYKDEVDEEGELEFQNPDEPVILDGWDPWTVVASLIKAGYIKVYEKYPTWSGEGPVRKKKCDGCVFREEVFKDEEGKWIYCSAWEMELGFEHAGHNCPYITHGTPYKDYHEVKPEELPDPATWKPDWVPISNRKKEYIGFRRQK